MKRKVEIPFEEIEKNGSGGKHRHGAINGEGKFKVGLRHHHIHAIPCLFAP
jgi:hypothetical protein